jgi:hypothetical protein
MLQRKTAMRVVAALGLLACGTDDTASDPPPADAASTTDAPPTNDARPPGDAAAPPVDGSTPPRDADPTVDADPQLDVDPSDAAPPVDASLPPGPWRSPVRETCPGTYGRSENLAIMDEERLDEASGLAASPTDPRVLWLHNDSGDVARLFALDTTGRRLGLVYLRGIENVDFEDLAIAACPDGSGPCLWVGDIGMNSRNRDDFVVYALPEPAVRFGEVFRDFSAERVWRFPVRYPGGGVDSEALIVDPDGQGFRTVEKVDGPRARVFRHPGPLEDGVEAELALESTLSSPGFEIPQGRMITGAHLHPTGTRLLLRVYTGSYEYRLEPGQTLADLSQVSPTLVSAGPLSEPQGEAIAYDGTGLEVLTVSEDPRGDGDVPIHRYRCQP